MSTISGAFSPSVKENECLAYIWLYITIFVLVMLFLDSRSRSTYKIFQFVSVGYPSLLGNLLNQ